MPDNNKSSHTRRLTPTIGVAGLALGPLLVIVGASVALYRLFWSHLFAIGVLAPVLLYVAWPRFRVPLEGGTLWLSNGVCGLVGMLAQRFHFMSWPARLNLCAGARADNILIGLAAFRSVSADQPLGVWMRCGRLAGERATPAWDSVWLRPGG